MSEFVRNMVHKCIQDPITQDWWVMSENENFGYFPAFLFSHMTYVDQVGWDGRATTTSSAPSPPLGSGYFLDDIFQVIRNTNIF